MPIAKTLLFASANSHKLEEIRLMLPVGYALKGLLDISWTEEIPEPYDTFEANAKAKASFVFDRIGLPCFADDSGLEVDALDGRPGVRSARYAGEQKSSEANLVNVLQELGDNPIRTARFIAVIAYQEAKDKCHLFTGSVEGSISYKPEGKGGFGYDPIFIPLGFDKTFANLPGELKNKISHRALALQKFLTYLERQ